MCTTCGCSDAAHLTVTKMHGLDATTDHGQHLHHARDAKTLRLEQDILGKNDLLAAANRSRFARLGILALNLLSAPGSGKTSLLERSLRDLRAELDLAVVEGDQHTLADARRIRETGVPVVQLNTGAGCHLEADMLAHGLDQLDLQPGSVVFIENVGNLVCPAMFDLGEQSKVVMLSVTEGDDKPLKYPHIFRASQLMLINKIDLLPYVSFDVQACIAAARQVNPEIEVLEISATSGEGLDAWYSWLKQRVAQSQVKLVVDGAESAVGAVA